MQYFTVLIPSSNSDDQIVTFQAEDFDAAMNKVSEDFPDVTYRLFSGKGVPQKESTNQKVPPTWPVKK